MVSTVVGYTGGTTSAPTYRSIGDHTEAILVAYDKIKLSYAELLKVFWSSHEPATGGFTRQYRNAVFTTDDSQIKEARKFLEEIKAKSSWPVGTSVEAAKTFYPAEDYHQKYYLKSRPDLEREVRKRTPSEAAYVASTLAARLNGAVGGYIPRARIDELLEKYQLPVR